MVHDHVADDGTYYLIGTPATNLGTGMAMIDRKVVIWRLDLNPQQECPTIQSFVIDFMVAQHPLLKYAFWGKILDLEIDEEGMTAQLGVAETSDASRAGLLGHSNVGLLSARFERDLKCKTKNTFTVQTATRTYPGIQTVYSQISPANKIFQLNGEAEGFGKSRSIRVFGRQGASLDGKYYQKIVGLGSNPAWKGGFVYAVTASKKFVANANNNPDSDGLMKYPTAADGSVQVTNNNVVSVLIVSTQKAARQIDQDLARLLDGKEVMFSGLLAMVTGSSDSSKPLEEDFDLKWQLKEEREAIQFGAPDQSFYNKPEITKVSRLSAQQWTPVESNSSSLYYQVRDRVNIGFPDDVKTWI